MTDAVCLTCRRPIDEHLVKELRECDPTRNAMPYEELADGPVEQEISTMIAGALTTLAATVDGGPIGKLPAVVFRFFSVDGAEPFPDMTLVLDDAAMRDLRRLIGDAADSAIKAARKGRR